MEYKLPSRLKSDYDGYSCFVDFYEITRNLKNTHVVLDFNHGSWFEANLCAAIGAVLYNLIGNNNTYEFRNLSNLVQSILEKNLFLLNFQGGHSEDKYSTTIKFRKFNINAESDFVQYLDRELLSQPDLPNMTPLLKTKINRSIFEIYSNAYIHGGCNSVYTCGQYYPNRKVLDFTMADLGSTIRSNVRRFLKNSNMSGSETISWAVEEGHTTKTGSHPGGLGLSLIREFLKLNEGKIQIVSSNGYWEEKKGTIIVNDFKNSFVGTIVNLEFNIDDKKSYALKEELNPQDIF